jgi:hypothetical protein
MRHLTTALIAVLLSASAPLAPVSAASLVAFRLEPQSGAMPRVVRLALSPVALRAAEALVIDRPVRATATPADADWGWERIKVEGAWSSAPARGAGAVVAVVDSGVDLDHPSLVNALWTNPGEIAGNGIDDDENGYVDDLHGWDVVDSDGDPDDEYGHGTHVAGIIAAADDGEETLGVAPSAKIMAIRVLGTDGGGSLSDVIEGIGWAVDHGANIVNLSIGADLEQADLDLLQPTFDAARDAGALVVVAAGNDGPNDPVVGFPAGQDGVLAVASIDDDRTGEGPISYFSSTHRSVDLAAPGYGVLSTLPDGLHGHSSGTSMAAPHVAGVAALILGERPAITPAAIEALLGGSAERFPLIPIGGIDAIAEQLGDGVLDAAAAVAANAANAGQVAMSERYLEPGRSILVTPLRPSGSAPSSCSVLLRRRLHPGVSTAATTGAVTRSSTCAPITLTAEWIATNFPTLSGVADEPAELELVATVDGTISVRRLLVAASDSAAPVIVATYPRLGAGGIITSPLSNIATVRSETPDAIARFEMRMRTIGAPNWSVTYPLLRDGNVSYDPRIIATRTINLTASAGRRIEIQGRAEDAAGNVSAWTPSSTAVVPQWLNPLAATGSARISSTLRSGAIGGEVLVGTRVANSYPKLVTAGFTGNLVAFTGTYSTSAPVCYSVRIFWKEGALNKSATTARCTNSDWAGEAGRNDETGVAYVDGQERVLLFRWAIPSRSYTKVEIWATSMTTTAAFEIDAIATKLP